MGSASVCSTPRATARAESRTSCSRTGRRRSEFRPSSATTSPSTSSIWRIRVGPTPTRSPSAAHRRPPSRRSSPPPAPFDLNDDRRHRAYWTIRWVGGSATTTLLLVQDVYGTAVTHTVFEDEPLAPQIVAWPLRAFFGARNGGLTHETQIDNAFFVPEPGLGVGLAIGLLGLAARSTSACRSRSQCGRADAVSRRRACRGRSAPGS